MMENTLAVLLNRLDSPGLRDADVIPWAAPVPSFGDLFASSVASVGLNPSDKEFVDSSGEELRYGNRRFHTLRSFGLSSWLEADSRHLRLIVDSCRLYFQRNPYHTWFKRLDRVLCGTGASFYTDFFPGCHLDLVPYATACKWMELEPHKKASLLNSCGDALGLLLRDSPIRVLILNGRTVVEQFQVLSRVVLDRKEMPSWALPRDSGRVVNGCAYLGMVEEVGDVRLDREIVVLGYNHNIQSSFGVTTNVITAIRNWVAEQSGMVLR